MALVAEGRDQLSLSWVSWIWSGMWGRIPMWLQQGSVLHPRPDYRTTAEGPLAAKQEWLDHYRQQHAACVVHNNVLRFHSVPGDLFVGLVRSRSRTCADAAVADGDARH